MPTRRQVYQVLIHMEPTLQAGFTRVAIDFSRLVATGHLYLAGYGARKGPATGIYDDCSAHALAIKNDSTTYLIIALDMCVLTVKQAAQLCDEVSRATQVPSDAIFINISHTHSSPVLHPNNTGAAPPGEPDLSGACLLATSIATVEAALGALADLHVVKSFRTTFADCPSLSYPRRKKVEGMPKGTERSMTIGDGEGPTMGGVHVWSFERSGKSDILLLSAAAHGCVLPPENLEISAEWIGGVIRRIEADYNEYAQPVNAMLYRAARAIRGKASMGHCSTNRGGPTVRRRRRR